MNPVRDNDNPIASQTNFSAFSNVVKKFLLMTVFALLAALPFVASAQTTSGYQFQSNGIFSCNQNGAYAMSVGSQTASGIYVPVADATVELNTGILVYKECILREVVDREREAATSNLNGQAVNSIQTGRQGNPQYVVNQAQESLNVVDQEELTNLQNGTLSNLNSALQQPTTRALAQQYEFATRGINQALTCPYTGNLQALESAQAGTFSWSGLLAEGNPACNPIGAYYVSSEIIGSRDALALAYQDEQWAWGNGYYSKTDNNPDPLQQRINTPASVVQLSFQTILDSPVHQLEQANDIGQMIGALYAGESNQILADTQGLAGLSQPVNGQPSYLSQIAVQSQQGLQGAVENAALSILESAEQIEANYFKIVSAIASSIAQTIQSLRDAENTCWSEIVSKTCTSGVTYVNGSPQCSDSNGDTLHIATSTVFSTLVINEQIGSLASSTVAQVNASQQALQLLGQLIAEVTNTSSTDVQNQALDQLDQMVANHQLHTQADLATVTQQQTSVQSAMSQLLQSVPSNWSGQIQDSSGNVVSETWDGVYPPQSDQDAVGWCNINDQNTINAWIQRWK